MYQSILNKLENIKERIELKIDDREYYFYERSDKWKESDKGLLYEEKTSELQDVLDSLDDTARALEIFLIKETP
jgi:hypothetical protein